MLFSAPLPYQADASAYFAALRDLPWAAWLDSGGGGRYDILVAQPIATITTRGGQTQIQDKHGLNISEQEPFGLLRQQLGTPIEPLLEIPFAGGVLGYWGYDLARRYHRIPEIAQDAENMPEMAVGVYDWAVVLDRQELSARLVSRIRFAETEHRLPKILEKLNSPSSHGKGEKPFSVQGATASNFTHAAYRRAFDTVQRFLHEGDCYQINLAQRFAAKATGDAFAAYLELRRLSPAPYSAFIDFPPVQILCTSPERFLKVEQANVETKPIKGTRPRSSNVTEDVRLAEELSNHQKDRAENLMIVDLLRNDLGRSCEPGSVRAPKLFEVESFANVHHLVSTVEGKLKKECDALNVLRDCFPGGSVTGVPKQRAMEITEQLEPHRRGVYCGVIGYIGHDGNMDTNIAIRTLVYSEGTIRCWAGGGVVADSKCDAEYQETLDKASGMLELLRRFGGKTS